MTATTVKSGDTKNRKDNSDSTYEEWNTEALQLEIAEDSVFMAKMQVKQPRSEKLSKLEQFMAEQVTELQRIEAAEPVENQNSQYQLDHEAIVSRLTPIDGALQRLVPTSLFEQSVN